MLTKLLLILFEETGGSDVESTIIGAFKEGTDAIANVSKAVGVAIAGLATIITGLGAVYLLVSAMIEIFITKSQGNPLADRAKILALLVACSVACGFITTALLS